MHWSKAAAAALAPALLGTPLVSAQNAPPPAVKYVVVIDAAHGGDDGGARLGSGALEKSVTLAVGTRLRSLLAARGISVVTTRDGDTALDADKRAGIANHANASLCLSLHATESGSGIHIFTSSLAPAAAPGKFPAWKTAQSTYVARSTAAAGVLNAALAQAGFTVMLGRTGLPGIDSMTCPALAIEIAPERANDAATAEPDDAAYQTKIAQAIAAAVLAWKQQEVKP